MPCGNIGVSESVLSPTRRLPSETLGLIFAQSLPEYYSDSVELLPHAYKSPVQGKQYREVVSKLEQVFRHWRNVSTATPQLWAEINL